MTSRRFARKPIAGHTTVGSKINFDTMPQRTWSGAKKIGRLKGLE